jgi:hypothetical protein
MTSTAVVVHEDMSEKVEWAKTLAVANLLPKAYQNNPGNVLFAVEYADALGISRINAITSIHVIDGRPSASADLIAALVRRAGHKLRVTGDDTFARAELFRSDDPDFMYAAQWDMDKARAAGLANKGVWKNYPAAMLRSRAITEVARMGASEALLGLIYTPEELGADVDQTGAPTRSTITATVEPRSGADRVRAMVQPQPEPEPTPIGDAPEAITAPQMRNIQRLFKACGIDDHDARVAWESDEIGRDVTGTDTLTKDEAGRCIEALERLKAMNEMAPPADAEQDALIP